MGASAPERAWQAKRVACSQLRVSRQTAVRRVPLRTQSQTDAFTAHLRTLPRRRLYGTDGGGWTRQSGHRIGCCAMAEGLGLFVFCLASAGGAVPTWRLSCQSWPIA